MTKEQLFSSFKSSPQGLTTVQAQENTKFGLNILDQTKKASFAKKFFAQFKNLMIIVLLIAAVVSVIVSLLTHQYEDLFEGCLIFVIVIINAIIGVIQENKAEVALELLSKQTKLTTRVVRDGKVVDIFADQIVCGDIVKLKMGDQVPADVLLIDSNNLQVDESSLTGESISVEKDHNFIPSQNTTLSDKQNCCYKGTNITHGRAIGIVYAVGKQTEIGKISKMLKTKADKTPLEKNMEQIGKMITFVVLAVVFVVFLTQLLFSNSFDFMQSFLTAIALAVAAIPESLPAVVTIIMALGVEKLAKHGAIVKTLASVETLGSCTCLATDKTGTLTQNKMTVKSIYFNKKYLTSNFQSCQLDLLVDAINCCNNAIKSSDGFIGDATEVSLKQFTEKHFTNKLSKATIRLDELPFDSTRKVMSTLNKIGDKTMMFCKGAFDFLISKCTKFWNNDKIIDLTVLEKAMIEGQHESMAKKGQRVIAVAYKETQSLSEDNLVFLGLIGIVDPPKTEVKAAIEQCLQAGLKPIMITGDHPATAFAIAKELGIATSEDQVLTGSDIDSLSEKDLAKTIKNTAVFARVSPAHKTKLVSVLQKKGHVVGFTGDGINDAPSVKIANIGVCMGNGTAVTKSAADLIVSTNDYSTIVLAIKQGRTIFNNIQKTLMFLISTNMVEVLGLFVCAICLPHSSFLLPSQILFINLVTDSLPAFALGLEKPEKDIMQKPPRKTNSSIFSGIGWHILLQGFAQTFVVMIMFVVSLNIWGNQVASTMIFITICLMQLIHAINCKTLRSLIKINPLNNKTFNISFVGLLALILIISLIPIFQTMFNLTALTVVQWLIVCLTSLSIIPIVEVCKYIINHHKK